MAINVREEILSLKVDNERLPSGIQVRTPVAIKELNFVVNPWVIFLKHIISGLIEMVLLKEVMLFSSAANNILRETMIAQPGFAGIGRRPNLETQVITNNTTSTVIKDEIRDRSRFSVPITLVIWFISHVYAASESARPLVVMSLVQAGVMPKFMLEKFKSIRMSRCGKHIITPSVGIKANNQFIFAFPQYKNTFFDANFLLTGAGINATVSLIQVLNKSEGNYIEMVSVDKDTIPPFEAAYTTTATSLSYVFTTGFDFTDGNVLILQGHSYGTTVNAVHVADTVTSGSVLDLRGTDGLMLSPYHDSLGEINTNIPYISSISDHATHIVMRVSGMLPNNNRTSKPPVSKEVSTRERDVDNKGAKRPTRKGNTQPKVENSNSDNLISEVSKYLSTKGYSLSDLMFRILILLDPTFNKNNKSSYRYALQQ